MKKEHRDEHVALSDGAAKKFDCKDGIFTKQNIGYFKYLFMWFAGLAGFLLCEGFIDQGACHSMHCFLDDLIPFCEYFVIFYCSWHVLIFVSLVYFALFSKDSFRLMCVFMTVCQVLALVVFIVYPSKQELRPEVFPRDNIFSDLVGFIYSVDTNTNVCPSLHVAYSFAMLSAFWKDKNSNNIVRAVAVFMTAMICLSIVFVKQHSAIDFFVALPVCLAAEAISCRDYWKEKFAKRGKKA